MRLRARAELSDQRAKYCGWSWTSSRLLYALLRKALSTGAFMSVASVSRLPPQPHRLLAWPVGEREKHRLAVRVDLERHPGGDDERVAGLEFVFLVLDGNSSFALDDGIDGAVGGAVGLRPESLRQELDEGGNGRHRVAAGEGIGELHLPAVAGVGILVLRQQRQRLAAALVRVVEDRRGLAERRPGLERHQAAAEAGGSRAFAARDRLHFLGVELVELRGEGLHDADVEAVHPYHRLVAGVAVVVEGPRGRDDEIARPHGGALAVDRRVGARALDDEAQRRLRMAVAGRDLARQDELQPRVQALRDARLAPPAGGLRGQHPAHPLPCADQPSPPP